MSHAGNIKGGGRGTYIGPAPTRSQGLPPGQARKAGQQGPGVGNGAAASEERTQIGRPPSQADSSRPGGVREEKPTGIWNFSDGLEQGAEPRAGKARDGQAGRFEGAREGSRSTGERPRLPGRGQEKGAEVTLFENRSSPRTGERPQLSERRTSMEAPRPEVPRQEAARKRDALATLVQVPVATPEGAEVPGAEARPLEDLIPAFSESMGEEALAHHFGEEMRFLGAELRPSRMAPSERAERLWSFFRAYAEANARDPAGQSEAGRERFREVLTQNGFTGLRDANTGRDGVEVALQMLEARSPEELQAKLAEVRIEPGPQMMPSEVSTPVVEEHITEPEMPAVEAALPQELKDSQFQATPERPVQKQPGAEAPARFDQAEQPQLAPLQAGAHPQQPGVMVPGMVPPGVRAQRPDELRVDEDGVPTSGHARRGTNKRLGSHMLWNFLHRFRDSPEMSAVEREKWSQVAFGAILILVGAALLMAMLASL